MVLSKRERYIGITTGVVLGAAVFWWVILGPLWGRRAQAQSDLDARKLQIGQNQRLIKEEHDKRGEWDSMVSSGLKRDQSEAQSQIVNSVHQWAQDAGVELESLRPDRTPEKEMGVMKMSFRATGSCDMSQLARFLWQIENASIPVRITDLTINAKKEATDDLSINLGLATMYLAADAKNSIPLPTPQPSEVDQ